MSKIKRAMMLTTPSPLTSPHLFRQFIVTNSRYWLERVEREDQAVLSEMPQLFRALDYVLVLDDEAGAVGYELLSHLSPLMIRQGQFQAWEGLLRRGIARSAAEGHPAEIELRLHLGNIYRLQGRLTEAQECLEAGLTLCEQYGDSPHERTLLNYLGLVARLAGDHEAALVYSQRVLTNPKRTTSEGAEAFNVMGLVSYDRREWNEALNYFDQALSLYDLVADNYHIARMLNNRGLVLRRSGQLYDAQISYEKAIQKFQEAHNQVEVFKATMNLGNVFLKKKVYDKAIEQYQKALPIFKRYNYSIDLVYVYNNLGMAYAGLEDWRNAEIYFSASIEIARSQSDRSPLINILDNFGSMLVEAKRLNQAEEILQQAFQIAKDAPNNVENDRLREVVKNRLNQLKNLML